MKMKWMVIGISIAIFLMSCSNDASRETIKNETNTGLYKATTTAGKTIAANRKLSKEGSIVFEVDELTERQQIIKAAVAENPFVENFKKGWNNLVSLFSFLTIFWPFILLFGIGYMAFFYRKKKKILSL